MEILKYITVYKALLQDIREKEMKRTKEPSLEKA